MLDLDQAPEKLLMQTTETVAAPTLLYVKNARREGKKARFTSSRLNLPASLHR